MYREIFGSFDKIITEVDGLVLKVKRATGVKICLPLEFNLLGFIHKEESIEEEIYDMRFFITRFTLSRRYVT